MRRFTTTLATSLFAVLLIAGSSEAQLNGSLHWGFMRANAIYLEPSLSDFRSGNTWLYGDFDFGYVASDKLSIHVGGGGFTAESSVATVSQGVPLTFVVDVTVVTFPLFARLQFSERGQAVRAFLEAGPSISSVEADISGTGGGQTLNLGVSDERFGFSLGLGFVARPGKGSLKLIPRVRYNYISKADGATFDASNVTVTIGIGFGRM